MGYSIYFSIPRLDEWAARFAEAPATTAAALNIALEKSAVIVERQARINAPVRTGLLRNSIKHKIEPMRAVIYTNKTYASMVEGGTGVYGPKHSEIRASDYGKQVFATKINPGFGEKNRAGYYIIGTKFKGQQRNAFMEKAYYESRAEIRRIFWDAGQALLKELGGK